MSDDRTFQVAGDRPPADRRDRGAGDLVYLVPKERIYFSMAFSPGVEMLDLWKRAKRMRAEPHQPEC